MKTILPLITLLTSLELHAGTKICGMNGTLDQRRGECATVLKESASREAYGHRWAILTFDGRRPILWEDSEGKVWTHVSSGTRQRHQAASLCTVATDTPDFKAGLAASFRLASTLELESAKSAGYFELVGKSEGTVWTREMSGDLFGAVFRVEDGAVVFIPIDHETNIVCTANRSSF